jgi:hypothetical protein
MEKSRPNEVFQDLSFFDMQPVTEEHACEIRVSAAIIWFNNKHRILPPRFSNQEGDECVQKNGF